MQFYESFQEKMTRHETRMIGKIVQDAVKKYFPNAEVTIMGSYRRGKLQCGDVDILIVDKRYTKTTPLGALDELVERLKSQGHLSDHLTNVDIEHFRSMPSQEEDFHESIFPPYSNAQSYMGVFHSPQIPGKHRRIDIKFYPYRERIYASLYFTGNGYFNRSLRLFAKRKKGMKLDDRGLFTHPIGSSYKGKFIKVKTEKDVFDKLGLVYKEPYQRDGFDAVREQDSDELPSLDNLTPNDLHDETNHKWID